MRINTTYLVLKTNRPIRQDSNKLRGYIGNKFSEYPLLHNHYNDKLLYSYPLIQYQVINGQASILGIEEGSTLIEEIFTDINELILSDSYYKIEDIILLNKQYNVSTSRKELHYQFQTPWLALNTENYQKYKEITDWKDKKLFLNNILVGNILSMAKGLGIIVNKNLYVKSKLNTCKVKYKSINMIGFTGEFKVRFNIPDFFGLGKGVSQGFGTIKRIFNEETKENENSST